jgi:hypothetical protein
MQPLNIYLMSAIFLIARQTLFTGVRSNFPKQRIGVCTASRISASGGNIRRSGRPGAYFKRIAGQARKVVQHQTVDHFPDGGARRAEIENREIGVGPGNAAQAGERIAARID